MPSDSPKSTSRRTASPLMASPKTTTSSGSAFRRSRSDSTLFGQNTGSPRRIVMLLDRSGSMQGEPITQARKAIEACLATLTEEDSFGLMVFDNSVEAMHSALVLATREQRERARTF